jgi:outer membrane immunogenic protein
MGRSVMNKGLALSISFLVAASATAFAADLPTPRPTQYFGPPGFSWTGFYIGLNAGAAWNNGESVTIFDPTIPANFAASNGSRIGFIGGGQIGYNFQTGPIVWGVETDMQGLTTGQSFNYGPYGFLHLNASTNGGWLGTTRARLGYAVDEALVYVTGGVAYGGFNNNPISGSGNATSNVGYALGGGGEYAFAQHWTARLEVLYINLNTGTQTVNVTSGGVTYPVTAKSHNGGGIVRVGVNYLF